MYKMNGVVVFLLLITVPLLGSAQTWEDYDSLTDPLRQYIDKAITQANKDFKQPGKHINFHSIEKKVYIDKAITQANKDFKHPGKHINFHSIEKKVMTLNYYVRADLRLTKCDMGKSESEFKQRKDCAFQKGLRARIDCLVCRQKDGQDFVHCIPKNEAKEKQADRETNCMFYLHGQGFSTAKMDEE